MAAYNSSTWIEQCALPQITGSQESSSQIDTETYPDVARVTSLMHIPRIHQLHLLTRTPEDIWLNINFIILDMEKKPGGYNFEPSEQHLPIQIRLSRVCLRMREIVLRAPLLWTNLDSSLLRSSAMLDAFLSRSQECSISIDITDRYGGSGRFSQLLEHVDHWGRLIICAESPRAQGEFEIIMGHLRTLRDPKLTHLHIDHIYGDQTKVEAIFFRRGAIINFPHLDYIFIFPQHSNTLTELSLQHAEVHPSLGSPSNCGRDYAMV